MVLIVFIGDLLYIEIEILYNRRMYCIFNYENKFKYM